MNFTKMNVKIVIVFNIFQFLTTHINMHVICVYSGIIVDIMCLVSFRPTTMSQFSREMGH